MNNIIVDTNPLVYIYHAVSGFGNRAGRWISVLGHRIAAGLARRCRDPDIPLFDRLSRRIIPRAAGRPLHDAGLVTPDEGW